MPTSEFRRRRERKQATEAETYVRSRYPDAYLRELRRGQKPDLFYEIRVLGMPLIKLSNQCKQPHNAWLSAQRKLQQLFTRR